MGRGRQKAKNTKIARELKSFSPAIDYSALERELSHPDEPDYSKWIDPSDDEGDDTDFVEEQHQRRA